MTATSPATGQASLVAYSSSEDSDAESEPQDRSDNNATIDSPFSPARPRQKPRISETRPGPDLAPPASVTLPPLPVVFRDLYSSTVRTSTQDDPSLHAGRRRVTPHVVGKWPSHVYLEWIPNADEYALLSSLVADVIETQTKGAETFTLLKTSLSVAQPLHISLARSLALTTTQKPVYLSSVQASIQSSQVHQFDVVPDGEDVLHWHANEDKSRWFLVLKVTTAFEGKSGPLFSTTARELDVLLDACNGVAQRMSLPLLYGSSPTDSSAPRAGSDGNDRCNKFHVSLAWSASEPRTDLSTDSLKNSDVDKRANITMSDGSSSVYVKPRLRDQVKGLRFAIGEVKVRVGQDVSSIALARRRKVVSMDGDPSKELPR